MYPISDALRAALTRSFTFHTITEVHDGSGVLIATSYADTGRIEVLSVEVVVERRAKFARSFTAEVVDVDGLFVPAYDAATLDPLARPQIVFSWEVFWHDETGDHSEPVPLGRFVVEENLSKAPGGDGALLTISGRQRCVLISENPWTAPYEISAGITYPEAIEAILVDRAVGWTPVVRADVGTEVTPAGIVLGGDDRSDPWADAQKLAEADGMELFEDATGAFVLRRIPDPKNGTPVWTFDESEESSMLPDESRRVSSAEMHNGVIVRGSAPWLLFPVQGIAWDDDPQSPTYYQGPFGRKPKQVDDAQVASEEHANETAAALLPDVLGVTEEVPFHALPNPALDQGDIVRLVSSALKVDDVALIESLRVTSDPSASFDGTIRRQRRA